MTSIDPTAGTAVQEFVKFCHDGNPADFSGIESAATAFETGVATGVVGLTSTPPLILPTGSSTSAHNGGTTQGATGTGTASQKSSGSINVIGMGIMGFVMAVGAMMVM